MHDIVGLLPAAGIGSRLRLHGFPKELLPIGLRTTHVSAELVPSLVIEHSLRAFSFASIEHCWVIISPTKTEIVRYLVGGEDFNLRLAYLTQSKPRGLADAIDHAFPWVRDRYVSLALPDTVFEPLSAIATLRHIARSTEADLILGIFPTDKPEQLGPVELAPDGSVLQVLDKPSITALRNTWGLAVWSPRFTHLLHDYMTIHCKDDKEVVLGHAFQYAVENGLNVRGRFFEDGMFLDVGTPEGIAAILRRRL